MNKKIIYSDGNLALIIEGKIYNKSGVDKHFLAHLEELNTIEEIEELMSVEDGIILKVEKVTKEKYTEFLQQEAKKLLSLNKDIKRYFLYENSAGDYKLALDLLLRTPNFKAQNNNIIGNLKDLYDNRLNSLLKERVKQIL